MVTPWDIIAVQDPPKSLPWWRGSLGKYHIWFETDRPLEEEHNPQPNLRRKTCQTDKPPKEFELAVVAFFVIRTIPPQNWAAFLPRGLSGKVATLSVTTSAGDSIRIHNVYNQRAAINLELLAQHSMGDCDMLLGDFNLHDRLWTGPNGQEDKGGRELAKLAGRRGMRCLNKAGKLTYSRSDDPTKNSSVIDL